MLKTVVGDQTWLVEQPDHARVSGYLAAHWGGVNGFRRPGASAGAARSARCGEEFVFAVAQHDNGWWEWEAAPEIDERDGWPMGLAEVGAQRPDEGLQRWRLGIPRFADQHPLAALLISLHAYHLYAFAFDDLVTAEDEVLRHPLFGAAEAALRLVPDRQLTRRFLEEQREVQAAFRQRLQHDPALAEAIEPDRCRVLLKLLQLFDALSLLLAFHEQEPRGLEHVPRASWADRVTMSIRPVAEQVYRIEPFPFDTDPLVVNMPARVVTTERTAGAASDPLARLYAAPLVGIRFELRSGS